MPWRCVPDQCVPKCFFSDVSSLRRCDPRTMLPLHDSSHGLRICPLNDESLTEVSPPWNRTQAMNNHNGASIRRPFMRTTANVKAETRFPQEPCGQTRETQALLTYPTHEPSHQVNPATSLYNPEAEFLDVIGQKSSEFSFMLFTVTSANRFYPPPPAPWAKVVSNWFVMQSLYTETSSLGTLKIMPRNLNEIVCSRIWLLD